MNAPKKPPVAHKPAAGAQRPGNASQISKTRIEPTAADVSSPLGIAREVLRRLATDRLPPTPDNYESTYHRIAGTTPADAFPERELKLLAQALPRGDAEQLKIAQRFESAVADQNWHSIRQIIAALFVDDDKDAPNWGPLIRDLLHQMERRQAGLSSTSKQEALNQILEGSSEATLMFTRVQALVRGWAQMPTLNASALSEELASTQATKTEAARKPVAAANEAAHSVPDEWRELLAQVLENAIGMLLIDAPELAEESRQMARLMRKPDECEAADFAKQLRDFSYRVQWIAQDQSYIRQALLNILQLIIENIGELVVDDKWLSGQMSLVLELFAKPLDKNTLEELGERLRDVIYKQGTLKRSLSEAQMHLRDMLAHFINHLGELAESTGAYHSKMETFAERVSGAKDISELTGLIGEVITETRYIEKRAKSSQLELEAMRRTVDNADREIVRLEEQLEQASALVRHDALTGTLNRKGIDEMIARESARSERRETPLCLSLLDVDNFKQLNDTFGHTTGDDALKHLAQVIRENLRPQDSCGRYGGEEFIVLLPDTSPEGAVETMRRLQRELTKRFFLHENKKLLITFSAGVTQFMPGEAQQAVVDRADKAMYRAKRAGKNRVELA